MNIITLRTHVNFDTLLSPAPVTIKAKPCALPARQALAAWVLEESSRPWEPWGWGGWRLSSRQRGLGFRL